MALVVTHGFSSAIADDPVASAAGEVLPSHWNAAHTLTGVVTPDQGGTGVANNAASTITISGSFGTTFTVTAATTLTLPTTGTLAVLASPAFTGVPTAPTATAGTNTTQLATTAFVLANSGGSITPLRLTSADTVAQSNSTTAQRFSVYNTTSDDATASPANYERVAVDWTASANLATFGTQNGGTGTARRLEITSAVGYVSIKAGQQLFVDTIHGGTTAALASAPIWTMSNSGGYLDMRSGNAAIYLYGAGKQINTRSDNMYTWSSGTDPTSGPLDTGIGRATAAVVEFTDGTAAGGGYVRLNGVAVGSLPAASATYRGCRGTVTNATLALTAGIGAVVASATSTASGDIVPVFCDGTNWRIG